MDRRFLLAMVLSTLVVVIFYTWFIPAPRRPKPGAAVTRDSVATPAAGLPSEPVGADTSSFAAAPLDTVAESQAPATTFDVETPRVLARFSTRGGGLESWKLKEFEGATESERVEFVVAGTEPELIVDLGGRRYDLSEKVFQVERRPGPSGGEDIRFLTTLPGGVQVSRRFTIGAESALVDFEVEVANVPASVADAAIEVGWKGLPRAEKIIKADKMAFGAIVSLGEEIQRVPAGKFRKERTRRFDGTVHWAGARNKYFFAGIIPPENAATTAIASGDASRDLAGARVRVPVVSGSATRHIFRLYLGPLDYWKLKEVGFGLERAVDLGNDRAFTIQTIFEKRIP
jgi:YidC/Oxa1 family membrane protein insertase